MAKKRFSSREWVRIFERLNRAGREHGLPSQRTDSFVVASWNLRQFGGLARRAEDRARDVEAFRFIASVIAHFDLVALQEVKEDLTSLRRLVTLLPDYDLIVSDTTGNYERLAFLYRTGKVRQTDLAGEADISVQAIQKNMREKWKDWRDAFADYGQRLDRNPNYRGRVRLPQAVGFERAPHCVSFDVGSLARPLSLLAFNTHIFYGAKRGDRTDEFIAFLDWLYERWSRVGKIFAPNFFIFGDMNAEVASEDSRTSRERILAFIERADRECRVAALRRARGRTQRGLVESQATLFPFIKGTRWVDPPDRGSNLARDEFYDQIILMLRDLDRGGAGVYEIGVLDVPELVAAVLDRRSETYRSDRIRQQISDHLPIWLRVSLDTRLTG